MLVAHMNRHQKNNQCGGCTKSFLTEGELKVSERVHMKCLNQYSN